MCVCVAVGLDKTYKDSGVLGFWSNVGQTLVGQSLTGLSQRFLGLICSCLFLMCLMCCVR